MTSRSCSRRTWRRVHTPEANYGLYPALTRAAWHGEPLQRVRCVAIFKGKLGRQPQKGSGRDMICYQLVCKKNHSFEGWFRDSAAYDQQEKKGLLVCPTCSSKSVSKAPMAPAVAKRAGLSEAADQARDMQAWVKQVHAHLQANSEYVGEKFPEVARAIHYGDAAERIVHGEASLKEARELIEEGIPVAPIPGLPRTDS